LLIRQIDTDKGDVFDPAFLRISPKGTIPALVVPLEKTLSKDVDSRYRAITNVEEMLAFLDKSRSPISRTHTTSSAPALSLTPATIAFAAAAKAVIDLVHSNDENLGNLEIYNARDDASLQTLASRFLPSLQQKHKTLTKHISGAGAEKVTVSTKTEKFWQDKKKDLDALLSVLDGASQTRMGLNEDAQQKRADYFCESRDAWEVKLREMISLVDNQLAGPLCLGDQLCLADLHLVSWLVWVITLAFGSHDNTGDEAISLLESHIGDGFMLPKVFKVQGETREAQSKLAAFWDTMKARRSWQKVYGQEKMIGTTWGL